MRTLDGSAFHTAITVLATVRWGVYRDSDSVEFHLPMLPKQLDNLKVSLQVLGAELTTTSVDRLLHALSSNKEYARDADYLEQALGDIDKRLRDELRRTMIFTLDSEKLKYFGVNNSRFAKDINKKFPSVIFEIDEAGKCLALSRPTACVFHLMRAMEIGIHAVAACLSIPDPIKPSQRNWGHVLRKIKEEIDARNTSSPNKWRRSSDKDFFDSSYASLEAVRTAWRNNTMHVEKIYTDDEAENIFIAVRIFLKSIALRLNESGKPKA